MTPLAALEHLLADPDDETREFTEHVVTAWHSAITAAAHPDASAREAFAERVDAMTSPGAYRDTVAAAEARLVASGRTPTPLAAADDVGLIIGAVHAELVFRRAGKDGQAVRRRWSARMRELIGLYGQSN